MKKIRLFTTALLLSFGLQTAIAQPLIITNTSHLGDYPYEITTYLYYTRLNSLCIAPDWGLPFTFEPDSELVIEDGSFEWTSPWTNETFCLSEFIGFSCLDIALDWFGQRIYKLDFINEPGWLGVAGIVLKSEAVPCYYNEQKNLVYPYPTEIYWDSQLDTNENYLVNIFNGTDPEPVATIHYQDWGIFQTLSYY